MDDSIKTMAALTAMVQDISKKLDEIKQLIKFANCDSQIRSAADATVAINVYWQDYDKLIKRSKNAITAANRAEPRSFKDVDNNLPKDLAAWADRVLNSGLRDSLVYQLDIIHNDLVGPVFLEGGIVKCTSALLDAWRTSSDTVIDDRSYFEWLQRWLTNYLIPQVQGVRMLQDAYSIMGYLAV